MAAYGGYYYVSRIAVILDQANELKMHNTSALMIDNKFGILCNRKRPLSVKSYKKINSEIVLHLTWWWNLRKFEVASGLRAFDDTLSVDIHMEENTTFIQYSAYCQTSNKRRTKFQN